MNSAVRVKEILRSAKLLAAEYYQLTGKPLGITGEVAEHVAAEILSLELAPPRTAAYDAVRHTASGPETIQIKGRAYAINATKSQQIGSIKTDPPCDKIMLVLLDNLTLDAHEIWEADFAKIRDRLAVPGSKARNERGALSVSSFKSAARRIWPAELVDVKKKISRLSSPKSDVVFSKEAREKWVQQTRDSAFNTWLQKQITNSDGTVEIEKLYEVASRWGIKERYDQLNNGMRRMNIGNRLRKLVPKEEYEAE